jgi:hypothetical protein
MDNILKSLALTPALSRGERELQFFRHLFRASLGHFTPLFTLK